MGFEWWTFHSWMLNAGQSFLIVNECYLRCLAVVDAPPLRLNLDPDLSRISKFRCKIRRSYTKFFSYIYYSIKILTSSGNNSQARSNVCLALWDLSRKYPFAVSLLCAGGLQLL